MGLLTFKGGVHTYEGKELSMDKPTKVLMPKGDMVFLMSQHMGAQANPLVAKGDYVLMGQKIGEATDNISSNIISSVSGTVKAVEPRLAIGGIMAQAVVIENDHEYKALDGLGSERDYNKLSKKQIREIIKEAGIVGLGGAAFPTHVKLTPPNDDAIEYMIINAAECEPYLTADYRMMLEEPLHIIGGLKVMLKLFPNAKGIIAIEDNKPEAIELLKKHTANEDRIEIKICKTKYPQGGERVLIYSTTGKKISSKNLPHDVGCIVNNVDTAIAVYMAVCKSTPLMRRILTVTGNAVKEPCNLNVKIGTDLNEVVEGAGGFIEEPEKIISGGPMMGTALYTLAHPVSKNSSSIVALLKDEAKERVSSSCIRCGRCVDVCPGRIVPQKMFQAATHDDQETFLNLHGMECCQCGSCSYICPSNLDLAQSFKQMKQTINQMKLN